MLLFAIIGSVCLFVLLCSVIWMIISRKMRIKKFCGIYRPIINNIGKHLYISHAVSITNSISTYLSTYVLPSWKQIMKMCNFSKFKIYFGLLLSTWKLDLAKNKCPLHCHLVTWHCSIYVHIYCIFPSILQIFNFNCNCTMAIELVSNYFIVAVRYLITKFFLKIWWLSERFDKI